MQTSILPFNADNVGMSISSKMWVEITTDAKVYGLLLKYIPLHTTNTLRSARPVIRAASEKGPSPRVTSGLGLGLFEFTDHIGNTFHALHQRIGDPVGGGCGIEIFTNLVLFADESLDLVNQFLSHLIEQSELTEKGTFQCFSWHVRHQYWRSRCTCRARPIESVILPSQTINKFMTDVTNFLEVDTKVFYETHGIPYRRSYLFYGVPGTGKTSLIQAMAGHYKRSVSYLQPTDPDITDDSLREAINQLPENTIVVFEDIDSLFASDRSNKVSKSSLTFSGLLNALDGVGSANGQIFILTTNLREQLDPALIRNGRVDLHIEFTHATQEQIEAMWKSFYPSCVEQAVDFATSVINMLGERKVAALDCNIIS